MSITRTLAALALALLLLPACSDSDSSGSPPSSLATVDDLLARACELGGDCGGSTAQDVAQCPAELLAELDTDDIAVLEAFLTLDKAEQDRILACFAEAVCGRFGGSVLSMSDSDLMEPLVNCGAPLPAGECSGPVTATVNAGAELTFSWSPDCLLMGWLIEPADSGADQWLVLHEGANAIAPPITYGVVPAGAREIQPPVALVPGTDYKLILWLWTGPGSQDGVPIANITFTR